MRNKLINNNRSTVDSLYLEHPLSQTSLYLEQIPWSLQADPFRITVTCSKNDNTGNRLVGYVQWSITTTEMTPATSDDSIHPPHISRNKP